MIERLLERVPLGRAEILALDQDAAHLPQAARRLQDWAARHGADWITVGEGRWQIRSAPSEADIRWVTASLFDDVVSTEPYDAVLAHAFLDLVDLDRALPRLLGALQPGGSIYFSLNFDGLTAFLPEIDAGLDRAIVDAYHATMDARTVGGHPSGDSRTGRRLLVELPRHGVQVLAAGASDWVVFPRDGRYQHDEEIVLQEILRMVELALADDPTLAENLPDWVARRRDQLERGQLVFIAHQLDVMGRLPLR